MASVSLEEAGRATRDDAVACRRPVGAARLVEDVFVEKNKKKEDEKCGLLLATSGQ